MGTRIGVNMHIGIIYYKIRHTGLYIYAHILFWSGFHLRRNLKSSIVFIGSTKNISITHPLQCISSRRDSFVSMSIRLITKRHICCRFFHVTRLLKKVDDKIHRWVSYFFKIRRLFVFANFSRSCFEKCIYIDITRCYISCTKTSTRVRAFFVLFSILLSLFT